MAEIDISAMETIEQVIPSFIPIIPSLLKGEKFMVRLCHNFAKLCHFPLIQKSFQP